MSAQAAPGDMRIVSGLVSRIVQRVSSLCLLSPRSSRLTLQLPCNSGIRLSMLETDVGLRSSLDALLQLASLRPSSVLQCLASALDSLARVSPCHMVSMALQRLMASSTRLMAPLPTLLSTPYNHSSTYFTSLILA